MAKTNVLITGVAGFIGSNLAERLLRDGKYEVIGIDNLSYGVKEQIPDGVKFYEIDIRDNSIYKVFKNVNFVFHFAAKNCINDCQIDPIETADINVTGSLNVFEASRLASVKKVIYAESSALYEDSEQLPTPEWDIKPRTFYALSKLSSMQFAEAYTRFHGLIFTALRYFCVYGPRQDYRRTIPPVFSSFIINLLKEEQPTIFGNGEKRRDFIHVDDINDFHIRCMEDPLTDRKVFNLGSGVNYSINEIYQSIASLLKSDRKPLYLDDLPGEAIANLADITEAQKLDWFPKIGLEEGLQTSINFIREELKKGNIE